MARLQHYYRILGVTRTAEATEIKRAYRRLARKFHPDHHGGHPMAEERFRIIAEAYTVLGDDEARRTYDRYGSVALQKYKRPGVAGGVERFVANLEGILDARISRIPKRGRDLRIVAEIPLKDACLGGKLTLEVERRQRCGSCAGSRAEPKSKTEKCHVCGGSGNLKRGTGLLSVNEACIFCQSFGVVALTPCKSCHGLGESDQRIPVTVEIPPGVETGRRLVLRERGEPGANKGESGDLYIELQVAEHPLLKRDGHDLHCTIPISLKQAICGSTVSVPLLDSGTIDIRVRPGAENGQLLRLRGRGAPRLSDSSGDLIVRLELETPQLDPAEHQTLLDVLDAASSHPKRAAYLAAIAETNK